MYASTRYGSLACRLVAPISPAFFISRSSSSSYPDAGFPQTSGTTELENASPLLFLHSGLIGRRPSDNTRAIIMYAQFSRPYAGGVPSTITAERWVSGKRVYFIVYRTTVQADDVL